jgi:hypothetical protein
MADVTYNTASFPSLVRTVRSLLHSSAERDPLIVLAYKQRDVEERSLWGMLKEEGVELEKVAEESGMSPESWGADGAEGQGPVEVWIGRTTDALQTI